MTTQLLEQIKVVGALAPVNVGAGAWVGKPISMENYQRVVFLIYIGVTDGTGTVTVEKGTTASLGTAIAFNYRIATTGATAFSVLDGALTAVDATGLALVGTNDNKILAIEVQASELGTSLFVGVKVGASGSGTIAAIVALCSDARFKQDVPPDPTS